MWKWFLILMYLRQNYRRNEIRKNFVLNRHENLSVNFQGIGFLLRESVIAPEGVVEFSLNIK